jgi:subtilisin family serine protease
MLRSRFIITSGLIIAGLASLAALRESKASIPPSSTFFNIKNWGLINSKANSHIHALDAWRIEEGSPKVVVAVIDTGIDSHHRDLSKNIWHDPNEKDQDIYGWNFVSDRPNPTDEHGHGTHVSGIIGALADPQNGVSGVAHHVSIMSVKYYSDSNPGSVNLRNTIRAINYAVDHGAKIINYSGGGPEFAEDEYLAIKRAEANGVLVIAAAGNEHQNTDLVENYYYPAAYRLSNIISVAATDINNNLLPSSNWGKTRVDVAAPGENIFSTLPGDHFGPMSGTSQATAFVTGIAALLLAENPNLKPAEIRQIIANSVDHLPQLQGKLASGGRVNAYSALLAARGKDFKPNTLATRPSSLMRSLAAPSADAGLDE